MKRVTRAKCGPPVLHEVTDGASYKISTDRGPGLFSGCEPSPILKENMVAVFLINVELRSYSTLARTPVEYKQKDPVASVERRPLPRRAWLISHLVLSIRPQGSKRSVPVCEHRAAALGLQLMGEYDPISHSLILRRKSPNLPVRDLIIHSSAFAAHRNSP